MGRWSTHRHENPVESARTINLAWTAKVVCTLDEVRPFVSLIGSVRFEPICVEVASSDSELVRAVRRRLPDERRAITHHFSIAGQEGYVTVGVYEDGLPGEIFVRIAKEGSTVSGLMDAFATGSRLHCSMARPSAFFAGSSATCVLSPAVGRETPKSGMPSL
jgi:hypothetical protein